MIRFQTISSMEYDLIISHLNSSFKIRDIKTILAPYDMILAIGKWKEVLLVTDRVKKTYEHLIKRKNPYFMGIHFGDIKRNKFRISLQGITLLAEHVEMKTVLTEKGEQKVLYKHDLNKKDLQFIPTNIQKNNYSILINKDEEVLALGKYLLNREEIRKTDAKSRVIKNIMDKGWYLRKGK